MNRRLWSACLVLLAFAGGCHTPQQGRIPSGPHLSVLTYNLNWGAPKPELAAEVIRSSGAQIICLQETTQYWEQYLKQALAREYPYAEFRDSKTRPGGGLAFLSTRPFQEVAYVPSETGWFDGWIMKFETDLGPVQVINIHLRPPVSDRGSWVSGYFTTAQDRKREIELFYNEREPQTPTLVLGDFNDGEHSTVVQWLEDRGMRNALPQFDRHSPTWKWESSFVSFERRTDHILYSPEFDCANARVVPGGASDHSPVEAILIKAK